MIKNNVIGSFIAASLLFSHAATAKSPPPGIAEGSSNVLFLMDVSHSSSGNLVENGSFEDNRVSDWSVFRSINGWTTTYGRGIEIQVFGPASEGTQRAELDSHANSGMFQDIATGGTDEYLLEFDYTPRPRVPAHSNTIEVYWDGELINTVSAYSPYENWVTHSHLVKGAGATTRLEFRATGTNDSKGGYLDNVRLTNGNFYAYGNIVKQIVGDSSLGSKAKFGMVEWNDLGTLTVPISETGASDILKRIDDIEPAGGQNFGNAMTTARNHFTSLNSASTSSCERSVIFVITDGSWTDAGGMASAEQLFLTKGIETHFIILSEDQDENYFTTASQNAGSAPSSPTMTEDWQTGYNYVHTYINTGAAILSSSPTLTYSAPTIVPGVEGQAAILQSTFKITANHQWKGRLKKYGLTSSGGIGAELWDAGEKLNATSADDRTIWTVGNGNAKLALTTANRSSLASMLNENLATPLTDNQLNSLIEFLRGKDSYNEYPNSLDSEGETLMTGERWKLADIYNSEAVYVGKPSAYTSDTSNPNSEAYYRFINGYNEFRFSDKCGVACNERPGVIYVGSNSGKLHAFDYETGKELWAFVPPSLLPDLHNVISNTDGKSHPIYGVDGTPTIKDVYLDGEWRTILMAGLRQGGNSYFALDVTDASDPKHLFTIAHNTVKSASSYWDENGVHSTRLNSSNPPLERNYSKLGEAWSDPIIIKAHIGGNDRWVATIAGGYNGGNSTMGTHLFVLDLENGGDIIRTVSLPDNNGSNNIVSSLPPRITAITADSTTLFEDKGALLYITDLEGSLWKINMTSNGTLYETTRMFNAESTASNGRYSYHRLESTITSDNMLMHFFGTGDILNPNSSDSSIQNRTYGLFDTNFPGFAQSSLYRISNLQLADGKCPAPTQHGWYSNLGTNEKVTGPMTVLSQSILTPVYTPTTTNQCGAGQGKLVESNLLCGNSESTHILGEGIPTRAVVYNDKVYVGVNSAEDNQGLPSGIEKVGNLVAVTPSTNLEPDIRIESWFEEY